MHRLRITKIACLLFLSSLMACLPDPDNAHVEMFKGTLSAHLFAISQRDTTALKKTLSPQGDMLLILPKSKITTTTKEFVDYHKEWFKDAQWTFKTKLLHYKIGTHLGLAIVEAMYKEPNRNGKPYFNRMAISYTLQKTTGKWYVIKDHACSLEKSTDSEKEKQ